MGIFRILQRWLNRKAPQAAPAPTCMGNASVRVGDFAVMPACVSRKRAERALGAQKAVVRKDLLMLPDIAHLDAPVPPSERDYGPDSAVEWVLDLPMPESMTLTTDDLEAAFPKPWRQQIEDVTLYGIPVGGSRWTYVHAGGAPAHWRAISISKELLERPNAAVASAPRERLQLFHDDVVQRARDLRVSSARAREPVGTAWARAQSFAAVWQEASIGGIVVVRAPDGRRFDGRQVWDTLCGIGLEWGDMDLFHWPNPFEAGHDSFFDVWTSTPPGHFLPEEIRDNKVAVEDLVFGFQIARSANPDSVMTEMVKAAKYARAQLGGRLVDERGSEFDEAKAHDHVNYAVGRLKHAGLKPGTGTSLRIF